MDPLAMLLSSLPILMIFAAVFKKDKTVGAFVQLGGLQGRMTQAEDLTEQRELRNSHLKLVDKITFTLGVVNTALTPYVLGRAPQLFYLLYTPKTVVLVALRYFDFVKKRKQYLLLDFCYWANILLLYYVWCDPGNAVLFQVVFVISNGPLAWSMLAFSHSLIFHSYPHVTSVIIHASPALLTYGLRWHSTESDGFAVCGLSLPEPGAGCEVSTATLVWQALTGFYLWWIVLYYLCVFIVLGDYLNRRGFQTLYNRVVTSGPLKPLLASTGEWLYPRVGGTATALLKRAVYLLCHLFYGIATMAIAAIYWNTEKGHLAFLATLLGSTAWNGATHYFTAFTRKHDSNVQAAATKSLAARADTDAQKVK